MISREKLRKKVQAGRARIWVCHLLDADAGHGCGGLCVRALKIVGFGSVRFRNGTVIKTVGLGLVYLFRLVHLLVLATDGVYTACRYWLWLLAAASMP